MRTYIAIACFSLTCAQSARVHAHPAAAESPTFIDPPCMVVADKREQEYLDIGYSVLMDDTVIESGDIPVSDAKTHQFFALPGTIYAVGIDDIYTPFTELGGNGIIYPLWVTHGDVQRSAAAVEMATGVTADQTDLPAARVLETRPDLAGWLRITADDARRPITATQALLPVRWMLADVPAGVYTVTGYVFSPPYNAWAPRRGVVKVVDADHNPAAGAIQPVNEVVFAYQGRRVRGCVDVPEDTKLDAYYFLEEKPDMGWMPWIEDQAVESGDLEQCFHLDRSDVAGSIRLRWDLRPPEGPAFTLRSKDTFTWLQGKGDCTESATHCCDFPREEPAPEDAGAAGSGGSAGRAGSAGAASSAGNAAPAAQSGSGCTATGVRASTPLARATVAWTLVLAGLVRRRANRRRA